MHMCYDIKLLCYIVNIVKDYKLEILLPREHFNFYVYSNLCMLLIRIIRIIYYAYSCLGLSLSKLFS